MCRRSTTTCIPLDRIELPPIKTDDLDDVPPAGVKMAKPDGDHATVLESGRWKEAVQAYLAAISYLDGQVGRVLDALEKSPYKDNTIICLWGDHGWHLGEKEHWRKFALWEEATRAPFIWVVPGVTKPGGVCARTVDFMSIYPTLCDLAGIAKPAHVEGPNIRPLLADPTGRVGRTPAITTLRPEQPRGPHRDAGVTSATPTAARNSTTTPTIRTNGPTSPRSPSARR